MPTQPEADAALMLRVREGDTNAFAELVDRYKQPVVNLIARMLHDPAEAEDIAQNVFVQVYRFADRYEASAKFTTWLFTIARNLCLNELRRRSRRPAESLEALAAEEEGHIPVQVEDRRSTSPPDQLLRAELERKVEEAISQLPENQRLALLLCRQDELSYEEMAEVLGCSVSATKSLIHRGRETLKQRLKPYLKTGTWSGEDSK